jgi:predicted MFS family arabinose efflux permease
MTVGVHERANGTERPALVTRPLLVRFVSVAGVSISFNVMLSVVPLFARSAGASTNVAGLTTTALTMSTIAGYLPTPRLIARYGHRTMLAVGMLLLGLPALVLAVSPGLTVALLACVVRGVGFAICCVSGYALSVSIIPPERRGEGLALIGLVSGIPTFVALPGGVWLAGHLGYRLVFAVAAGAALAPLASLPWLMNGGRGKVAAADSMLAGLRRPALIQPALVFFATTMATGIFLTFVPLAAGRAGSGIAPLALLLESATAIAGRLLAGRLGDRARGGGGQGGGGQGGGGQGGGGQGGGGQGGGGQGGGGQGGNGAVRGGSHGGLGAVREGGRPRRRLLLCGVLTAAAGFALLSVPSHAAILLIAGGLLFGAGFGVTQNASLMLMYDRVSESGVSVVGALWNLAYDSGMGIGAAWFGAVVGGVGYPVAFGLTALIMVSVTTLNRRTKDL